MSIVRHLSIVLFLFSEIGESCRVEECALWFRKTKEYENLVPMPTERYCQILQTYLKCMNDTMRFCHGNLRFHSSELVMRKHWKEFECSKWDSCNENLKDGKNPVNTCYFNPPPRKLKYCALFGDPHLITFNGSTQTCSEEGARPLVDNRHFLVQVTNKNVRGEALTTTVTKITVLVRKHNCTAALRYEAAADEQGLPRGFIDGTTHQKTSHRKHAVEVLWQDDNYVKIAMHFIHSSIHIRRQGPYLSVAVRGPSVVFETGGGGADGEMCWTGCRRNSVIREEAALEAPKQFAECYSRRLHVPKKVAEDRCRDIGTTDAFFDACVFDLMLTGDDYLVHLAKNAQSDFRRLAPHHLQSQIVQNRVSFLNHSELPVFDRCVVSLSISIQSHLLFAVCLLIPIIAF